MDTRGFILAAGLLMIQIVFPLKQEEKMYIKKGIEICEHELGIEKLNSTAEQPNEIQLMLNECLATKGIIQPGIHLIKEPGDFPHS